MLPVVMTVIAIFAVALWHSKRQSACQCHENYTRKKFAHEFSLPKLRSRPGLSWPIALRLPDRRFAGDWVPSSICNTFLGK
jgi:hypothetical protein